MTLYKSAIRRFGLIAVAFSLAAFVVGCAQPPSDHGPVGSTSSVPQEVCVPAERPCAVTDLDIHCPAGGCTLELTIECLPCDRLGIAWWTQGRESPAGLKDAIEQGRLTLVGDSNTARISLTTSLTSTAAKRGDLELVIAKVDADGIVGETLASYPVIVTSAPASSGTPSAI